jgi:LmbE family N-acetylglucosaminyl deacetylase
MKWILFIICFFVLQQKTFAQNPVNLSSSEILLALQKLNTVGSVLYVAAHPDDENTRLLSYLANEKKVKATYLSLTRGDGGQNLIGKEQGEALGLIRTNELLAARRTDGAEQLFTRANDFGYSKNPEETMAIWNKDSVLYDVVLAIRRLKPDVIICRFPTNGDGGHGHHTASALLAQEAYAAAANPAIYPDQLTTATIWQVKRIYWNAFVPSDAKEINTKHTTLDVGVYNALLGKSYGEIAAESRSNHKSQGFGSAKNRGKFIEYFEYMAGDSATATDIFSAINFAWNRFANTTTIQSALEDCIAKYNAAQPNLSVAAIADIYKQLQALPETDAHLAFYKKQKLQEAQKILLACSGIFAEATADAFTAVSNKNILVNTQIITRYSQDVVVKNIVINQQWDTTTNFKLLPNELLTIKHKLKVNAKQDNWNAYWLNEPHSNSRYVVKDNNLIGEPLGPTKLNAIFNVQINGVDIAIAKPIVYKFTDPVKGEVYRNVDVLPLVTINWPEKVFVFTDAKPKKIKVVIRANADSISGRLQLSSTANWSTRIANPNFTIYQKNEEAIVEVEIFANADAEKSTITAAVIIDKETFNQSIQRIEYDHIPHQQILHAAEAKLLKLNIKKTGMNIAYINGAGDDVAACLAQIGYKVTVLNIDQIQTQDLSSFDAIITGIRAFNTNEKLFACNAKLMDYVKKGGNVIVQYNTNSRAGPLNAKLGPYPFTISRDRVTDELANMRITNPTHSIVNYPNKITDADFENWVQERGIYFATEFEKNYQTVFSCNDPKEKASEGSLITCAYGKGNFVYTGIVFFRELPAGVPGAYRLLTNIISMPKNK